MTEGTGILQIQVAGEWHYAFRCRGAPTALLLELVCHELGFISGIEVQDINVGQFDVAHSLMCLSPYSTLAECHLIRNECDIALAPNQGYYGHHIVCNTSRSYIRPQSDIATYISKSYR